MKNNNKNKRLKIGLSLAGWSTFICLLSGAPAYAYLICILLGFIGYFGIKKSEL